MSNLTPSSKKQPCYVCGDTHGKCRISQDGNLLQCMNSDQAPDGFVRIADTKDGLWYQFRTTQEVRHSTPARTKEKPKMTPELSADDRDRYYRQMLKELKLEDVDRADLERRGYTPDQIRWSGVVSVQQWHRLKGQYPEILPGVLPGNKLNVQPGMLFPVRDVDGRIVACQVRLREPGDSGRYRSLSSVTKKNPDAPSAHVQGEQPLAVHRPVDVKVQAIGLCEGLGAKPFLACHRLEMVFVGASAGLFGSSFKTLKRTFGKLSKELGTKVAIHYPDAGAVTNEKVLKTMRRSFDAVQKLGFDLKIAWWGQFEKGKDPDIDELTDLSQIKLLTLAEFLEIAGPDADEFYNRAEHDAPEEIKNWNQTVLETLYSSPANPWICCLGKLYEFTGTHYQESPDEVELKRIRELAERTSKISKKSVTYPFAKPSSVREALEWAKLCLAVQPEECTPSGINCKNGVLTWNGDDFELKPHSPDIYFLYEPGVEFKPDADPSHCNRLLEALEPQFQEIWVRTIAAAIDNRLVRQKHGRAVRSLLCRGTGANGKDALRECAAQIWGKSAFTDVAFEDFAEYDSGRKFPLTPLARSVINWASENRCSVRLDTLQSLKRAITGDALQFELKGKDSREFEPMAIHLFNVNDVPRITGGLEAIASRFAVIPFDKTFVKNADPSKGQLEADPRFKYDPEWIRENVTPALLNRLLEAFKSLMAEGIDYSPCDAAMQEIQIHNSHLFEFALEAGLTYDPDSTVQIGDLWSALENYYENTGVLAISSDGKRVWEEPIRPGDQYVKSSRQIPQRFLALYPKCTKVAMGQRRYGIKGLRIGPKPQEPQPPEQPKQSEVQPPQEPSTAVFSVGDLVELADGRRGVIQEVQQDTLNGGWIFAVKNGKPAPEWVGMSEIQYPAGTLIFNKQRNKLGTIVKFEDGLYQVQGDTFLEWVKPSDFQVRRSEA